jgi:hypothetical protein
MEEIDLKLKLFGGRPIKAEGFGDITPLNVREVLDIGYTEYMKYLNIMTLEVEDFLKEKVDDINIFDLLLAYGGEEIERMFESSLSLFLNGEAITDKENLRVFIKRNDDKIIIVNSENYAEVQNVIKWQNYINNFEEKKIENDFNPADEEVRKFKEKMDALKKQREELKKKQNQDDPNESNDIDFFDILSAISSKSFSVSELNVLDLTIYQVYRKFKRLEIIDQYDISIKSILAGGKDIKLKHWSSKD